MFSTCYRFLLLPTLVVAMFCVVSSSDFGDDLAYFATIIVPFYAISRCEYDRFRRKLVTEKIQAGKSF